MGCEVVHTIPIINLKIIKISRIKRTLALAYSSPHSPIFQVWLQRLARSHEALLRALGFSSLDPGSCWDGPRGVKERPAERSAPPVEAGWGEPERNGRGFLG